MIACANCKRKGIQADFNFCPYCGVEIEKMIACPQCGNTKVEGMRFCPECGSKITPESVKEKGLAEIVDLPPDIPNQGLTIEFGHSSSQNYDLAIAEAMKFPFYSSFGNLKQIRHRVIFNQEDIIKIGNLVNYIQGWKTSKIYENGEPATFQALFGFLWCYQERQSSFKPELYCFGYERDWDLNLWGCTQARLPFHENAEWFSYGKWLNKDGDWQFDKDRIRHELQIALYQYRYCPAINLDLVEEVLDAIPAVVNPKKSKDWVFIEDWGGSDITSGLIITTVRYGMKEQVTMKGVRPTKNGIKTIIKKIKSGKLPAEILK